MGHRTLSRHARRAYVGALLGAVSSTACLPEDTRKTPGSLVVTVTADTAAAHGFTTTDGWHVAYGRFLVVAGEIELGGDDCDPYAENDYSRVFDATNPAPQRSGVFYGLGRCDFGFLVSPPRWDTLLGAGVSEADAIELRTPGNDPYAEEAGISILVEGTAENAGRLVRFRWPFRRFVQYAECSYVAEDQTTFRGVTLERDEATELDLSVHGETFFEISSGSPKPATAFEPFRAADGDLGDGDGFVSLDELHRAPWDGPPGPDDREWPTLGDRVYLGLLQHVVRFRGTGTCSTLSSPAEPDDGGPF